MIWVASRREDDISPGPRHDSDLDDVCIPALDVPHDVQELAGVRGLGEVVVGADDRQVGRMDVADVLICFRAGRVRLDVNDIDKAAFRDCFI